MLRLHSPFLPALSPEEARQKFTLPPGFEIRLFASEPEVVNPVAMTWDERGRLRSAAMGVTLPDEVTTFLAKRIRANVRRLEGAMIRLVSYASLNGKPLSVPTAEVVLRDVLMENKFQLTDIHRRFPGPDRPSSSFGLN